MSNTKLKVGDIAEVIEPVKRRKGIVKHVFKVGTFVMLTEYDEKYKMFDCHVFGRPEAAQWVSEYELEKVEAQSFDGEEKK